MQTSTCHTPRSTTSSPIAGQSKRKLFISLTLSVILAFLFSSLPPVATANAAPADVVSTWRDSKGNSITLRQGTYNTKTKAGFGWTKIKKKHGINKTKALKFITNNPAGPTHQGTRRVYNAYANELRCTNGRCIGVRSVPVRLVHETASKPSYYGVNLSGKGRVGVMTAYCLNANNADLCPSWVNAALTRSATMSPETATGNLLIGLSYEPLEDETISETTVEEL